MPHKNHGVFEGKRRKLPDVFGQSKSLAGSAIRGIIKWIMWGYGCH